MRTEVSRIVSTLVLLMFIGRLSAGELLRNRSFEDGTGEPSNPYGLDGWVGYGNQEQSLQHAFAGPASIKMFGGVGNTGSYQVVPIPPGRRLHIQIHTFTPSGDALAGTAKGGIRIEFLGPDPQATEAMVVDSTSTSDLWQPVQLTIGSPPNAGVGRFACFWSDDGSPSGSVYWDATSVSYQDAPDLDLLTNAGFEDGEGGLGNPHGLADWIAFGNAELSHEVSIVSRSSLKLFGGLGFSGAFQDFRYDGRRPLSALASFLTRSVDHIGGTAHAGVVLQWPGPVLSVDEFMTAHSSMPTDVWQTSSFIAVPPDGTIAARIALVFTDGEAPAGAMYFDEASVIPILPGDTDGNGRVDGRDVQNFARAILLPDDVGDLSRLAADIGEPGDPWSPDGVITVDDIPGFLSLLLGAP